MNKAISLDTAIIVTGVSKRTLWRRLAEGQITRQDNDIRGRAMLSLEDLAPMLGVCQRSCRVDHTFMQPVAAVLLAGFAASLD